MATTEQPKYMSRPEGDPIRMAQEARAAKAADRATKTERQQELGWGHEKLVEVLKILRHGPGFGGRRTFQGWIENTTTVSSAEKLRAIQEIRSHLDFLENVIPRDGNHVVADKEEVETPVPDFFREA